MNSDTLTKLAAAAGMDFMWADVRRSLYLKGEWEVDIDTGNRHLPKEILLKILNDFQE